MDEAHLGNKGVACLYKSKAYCNRGNINGLGENEDNCSVQTNVSLLFLAKFRDQQNIHFNLNHIYREDGDCFHI